MIATVAAVLTLIGIAQAVAGWMAVRRFVAQASPPLPLREGGGGREITGTAPSPQPPPARGGGGSFAPPITVLKPLHGDEPLLEQALATVCAQDYPAFQIVFGVQDPTDSAIAAINRLRVRFPQVDIALVVDPTPHGVNRKIANLMNMLPAAKHDVLAIADSDLHVRPDYLSDLAATLTQPGCGLATTLYTGLPANRHLPALLGASQITYGFLPGALLARAMGRQDCLGATMCLRRETLMRIGGFPALVDHLADDNVLGQLVRSLGLDVRLAGTVVATTVPESTWTALFRHELRWARTIRALEPSAFAASVLQYPIFWSVIAVAASGGTPWTFGLFVLAWLGRAFAATGIDRALAGKVEMLAFPGSVGFLPLRELLSVAVLLASYAGKRVDWRGHTMHAAGFTASDAPAVKGLHKR